MSQFRSYHAPEQKPLYSEYPQFGSSGAPGPSQPHSDGTYVNIQNPYEAYFGRAPKPIYNQPYEREVLNLPDAYDGHNPHLSNVMITRITSEDMFWVRDVLPWEKKEDADNITWSVLTFNDHMLNRRPEQSVSRLLSFERSEESANFVCMGIAMFLESGFYKTQEGQMFYNWHLLQIQNATVETACLGAALALLNAKPPLNSIDMQQARTMSEMEFRRQLDASVAMFGIVQSTENGLQIAQDTLKSVLSGRGCTPNCTILPEGALKYSNAVKLENTSFMYNGASGGKQQTQMDNSMRLFESRKFRKGEHQAPDDPFFQTRTVGSYFHMLYADTENITDNWNMDFRTIRAWSEDLNDFHPHDLKTVSDNCGMWDNEYQFTRLGALIMGEDNKSWFSWLQKNGVHERFVKMISRDAQTVRKFGDWIMKGFDDSVADMKADFVFTAGAGAAAPSTSDVTGVLLQNLVQQMHDANRALVDARVDQELARMQSEHASREQEATAAEYEHIQELLDAKQAELDAATAARATKPPSGADAAAQQKAIEALAAEVKALRTRNDEMEADVEAANRAAKDALEREAAMMRRADEAGAQLEKRQKILMGAGSDTNARVDGETMHEDAYQPDTLRFGSPPPAQGTPRDQRRTRTGAPADQPSDDMLAATRAGEAAVDAILNMRFPPEQAASLTAPPNSRTRAASPTATPPAVPAAPPAAPAKADSKSSADNKTDLTETQKLAAQRAAARAELAALGEDDGTPVPPGATTPDKPTGGAWSALGQYRHETDATFPRAKITSAMQRMIDELLNSKIPGNRFDENWTQRAAYVAVRDNPGNADDALGAFRKRIEARQAVIKCGSLGRLPTTRPGTQYALDYQKLLVTLSQLVSSCETSADNIDEIHWVRGKLQNPSTTSRMEAIDYIQTKVPLLRTQTVMPAKTLPRRGRSAAEILAVLVHLINDGSDDDELLPTIACYMRSNGSIPDEKLVEYALMHINVQDATFFKFLLDARLDLPLSFLLFAPHMRFRCGSMVACKAGSSLGNTFFGNSDFQLARNAGQKTIFGHYTIKLKSVVTNARNIAVARDVYIHGYEGGAGHEYWQYNADDEFGESDVDNYQQGRLNGRDLFVVAVPPSFRPKTYYMDITGRFDPEVYGGEQRQRDHYPTANHYARYWQWSHGTDTLSREYEPTDMPRYNTLVLQGAQINFQHTGNGSGTWNRRIINKGHLSQRVYPGCASVRMGRAMSLQPIDYNSTATVAVIS